MELECNPVDIKVRMIKKVICDDIKIGKNIVCLLIWCDGYTKQDKPNSSI